MDKKKSKRTHFEIVLLFAVAIYLWYHVSKMSGML
jgi:hypothetical protein